jgi:hypothetical protein
MSAALLTSSQWLVPCIILQGYCCEAQEQQEAVHDLSHSSRDSCTVDLLLLLLLLLLKTMCFASS